MLKFLFQKLLLLTSLVLVFSNSIAQESTFRTLIFQADSLITVGRPQLALKKINAIDQLKDKKYFWQVKAALYRIKLLEEIEDEEINPIVRQLEKDVNRAGFPEKQILQSLLAETYWKYYQRNRYDISSRSVIDDQGQDISKWGIESLVNAASKSYKQSLDNPERLQEIPLGEYDEILKGDTLTRKLRPTLYDLLAHRALEYFLDEEPAVIRPKTPFTLNDPELFTNSHAFVSSRITTTDPTSSFYQGFKTLQQLTQFHLGDNDPDALADVELKRLELLYRRSTVLQKDTLYTNALRRIGQGYGTINAEAFYHLAEYYKNKADLTAAHYYAKKAITTNKRNLAVTNAKGVLGEIENRELAVDIEKYNLPQQNLLASISYKNVRRIRVKVMKLSPVQEKQLAAIEKKVRWEIQDKKEGDRYLMSFLNKIVSKEEFTLELPDFKDFKEHRTEFKISPCTIGAHVALVRDADSLKLSLAHLVRFSVTKLAFVGRQRPDKTKEILVLDRYSGKPVPGATVSVQRQDWGRNKPETIGVWKTNELGKVSFGNYSKLIIKLKRGADSIEVSDVGIYGNTLSTGEAAVKPVRQVVFFADRSIYRPGQTVYFKGLTMSTVNKRSSLSKGTSLKVELWNWGTGTRVVEKEFKTNNFGTFSGTFIIPEGTLNGEFQLRTEGGRLSIQVEEYKRPTFNVTILPLKDTYRFNDSIKVRGKVKALAGYGLANTKVAYTILKSDTYGDFRFYSGISNGRPTNKLTKLASDTVITDSGGNFIIPFKASVEKEEQLPGSFYTYNIAISSISSTGETRTANTSVTVGEKLIRVSAIMPDKDSLQDTAIIPISLSNLNGTLQAGKIRATVYDVVAPEEKLRRRLWSSPDTILFDKNEFAQHFPMYNYKEPEPADRRPGKIISDTTINITEIQPAFVKLKNLNRFRNGCYCLKLMAENEKGDTTSTLYYYPDHSQPYFGEPKHSNNWVIPLDRKPINNNISFAIQVKSECTVLAEVFKGPELKYSRWLKPDPLTRKISLPITEAGDFNIQFLTVVDNSVLTWQKEYKFQPPQQKLNVKLLTYRNQVEPGAREKWKVSVSGKSGTPAEAEVLVSMYDSSLDELKRAVVWPQSLLKQSYTQAYYSWNTSDFQSIFSSVPLDNDEYYADENKRNYEEINREIAKPGYAEGLEADWFYKLESKASKTKNTRSILDAAYKRNLVLFKDGFDVVGRVIHTELAYPWIDIKIDKSGFVTSVDKNGYFKIRIPFGRDIIISCKYYKSRRIRPVKGVPLLICFDGAMQVKDPGVKTIEGDPNAELRIDHPVGEAPPTHQALVAEDNAIYDVANMDVKAPPLPLLPPTDKMELHARKNFKETAFFYPHLVTDEKGEVLFEFTLPESLTSWKFRAFAHNKDMENGYSEAEVLTQKKLMVSANIPRFFREGDKITVQGRVVNLGAERIKGRARLEIYDPGNKEHNNLLEASEVSKDFTISGNGTATLSYQFKVPGNVSAVVCKISAVTGSHTDAEENIIPVLPNKIQITESMPMIVRAGEDKTFVFEKLMNSKSNGQESINVAFELTQNPSWTVVQALPFILEYPYECSEQIFNRYFANRIAADIVNKNKAIQKVFDQWKTEGSTALLSNLEKNNELKSVLLEETPWLKDAEDEAEQKRRIALLFELNKVAAELSANAQKLRRSQLSDGSFSWFPGGRYSDPFISKYILKGIGELKQIVKSDDVAIQNVRDRLIRYVEAGLLTDYRKREKGYEADIEGWYARSYFPFQQLNEELTKAKNYFLNSLHTHWVEMSLSDKAMLALTAFRYGDKELSDKIVQSLEESAAKTAEQGMFWQKNKRGVSLIQSPIETQALLIKVFTECTNNKAAIEEMKVWLMANKQISHWETTKATAAAIQTLLYDLTSSQEVSGTEVSLGDEDLFTLKPSLKAEAGSGYIKTNWNKDIKPAFGKVQLKNKGTSVKFAALHWQYLQKASEVSSTSSDLKLQRKYFIERQTDRGAVYEEMKESAKPVPGSVIKVILYLDTQRDLEYVHLKDLRPSGTEPESVLSGYKYEDRLFYYQVTKDASTNFFISRLPKGSYTFEYNLRAIQAGKFDSGIATIQSIYAPEVTSHTGGEVLEIR